MSRTGRVILLIASIAAMAAASWPDIAFAQRRPPAPGGRPPAQGRPPAPAPRPHPVDRSRVVFVGGYYYDPFFGPYPWWSRWSYPYFYYPEFYDNRAVVRIAGQPDKLADNAAVYVDGFYAGIVEDFDGFFEGLPLSPGGHEIVLYMNGYRTVRQRVYLSPASSFTLHYTPESLSAGMASEPPILSAPVPPPPEGTFIPPVTQREAPPNAPRQQATEGVAQGVLSLRIQPIDAEVRIDGERWASSDGGRYVVQLPAGTHRIEAVKPGYIKYSDEVELRSDATTVMNIALTSERP